MSTRLRTVTLTGIALLAFAGNSILCRMALGGELIGPAAFTAVRLGSGAAMLWLLVALRARGLPRPGGHWASATALFVYAAAFSLAYVTLDTGPGALILFGAVQLTMIASGLRAGERPRAAEWVGLALALSGLVVLVRPGLTAPAPGGSLLMATAGVAWGVYSLRGRASARPLLDTAGNFLLTVPAALGMAWLAGRGNEWTPHGVGLAVASGALASGGGYAIWYAALPALTATRAALVQLLVPVIAALGGIVLLSETLPLRLPVAAALVLGGVALAVTSRDR